MSKQTILNYEVQMIEYHSQGLTKPDSSPNHQYTTWQLDQKILQLMGSSPCTIRWIGNHDSAYLDAFVYVMLSTALKKQSLFLKLKSNVYQLSQKYLEKSCQKLIVEFLCLMQYTHDKYSFLRKYPEVVKMIVSILKSFQKQTTHKDNMKMSSFILESPVKQKRKQSFSILCEKFDFIQVFHPHESTYKFMSDKTVIFVVVEKDCFFVVEKYPVLSDEKDQSAKKTLTKMKYSTPRFWMSSNTLTKPRSQKKRAENHMIHRNKKSENLLDHYNNNQSIECSIEEIYGSLNNCEEEQKANKKQQTLKYRTQTEVGPKQGKKQTSKSRKKDGESSDIFLIKQFEYQQKRRQHWLKLEREYYERKKEISKKIKHKKIKIKNQQKHLFNRNEPVKSQKQRKMSFNSFTGTSLKDRVDTDFAQLQYDKKSTTKSHQGQNWTKEQVRERKVSLRQSPVVKKKMLKKKTSNQIYINQDNRLSVIQEENRLKFWNFNSKPSTNHRSPKYTSFNSSNRETIDANICVTFNYINKHAHNSEGFYSPNVHKMRSGYVSPIRV